MDAPRRDRPFMPGYGILAADQGTGLLRWDWAVERLVASHEYWVATCSPSGHPHVMPVWGAWYDDGLWFSSSNGSRKARNLAADARCAITTDNAHEPVVVEGSARRTTAPPAIERFVDATNAKYGTDYAPDFFDPALTSVYRVAVAKVIALDDADFTGSPTRWTLT